MELAINPGKVYGELEGIPTKVPAFGLEAVWIDPAQRDYARSRYDYLINLVRLKSASGVLAPADLASINAFLTTPTALPPSQPPSPPPAG